MEFTVVFPEFHYGSLTLRWGFAFSPMKSVYLDAQRYIHISVKWYQWQQSGPRPPSYILVGGAEYLTDDNGAIAIHTEIQQFAYPCETRVPGSLGDLILKIVH